MLKILSNLTSSTVIATDGSIGHLKAAFFDDKSWTIRYLVVDTEDWLPGREVLISPYAVKQPMTSDKKVLVGLTRQKVRDSPDIDTHQPVSRQHEREYSTYYTYPEYWYGDGIWGDGAYPLLPPYPPTAEEIAAAKATRQRDLDQADVHLRSSVKVSGYEIQATDNSIGHVKDFIFDDESWEIPYLVVDTRNWWPGGKKVLISSHWIDHIDWSTSTVYVSLTRADVQNSPEFGESTIVDRTYEQVLHDTYSRIGYWDRAKSTATPTTTPKADVSPVPAPVTYLYSSHAKAEEAIKLLVRSGFAVKNLSLIGKGYHSEEQPIGFYSSGDKIKAWGGAGAFWGGIWGLLLAPAIFFIPGIGLLAMAGPIVSTLVGGIEGALVVGSLSALGAALLDTGVPRDDVMKYESALKADSYLLVVHGNTEEAAMARNILAAPAELKAA